MLIHELTLHGVLSFGPDSPSLALQPLNVLIGPNGSGKSNLVEAIGLLRSAATKLTAPMRGPGGGGVTEWIWKGMPSQTATVDAVIEDPAFRSPLVDKVGLRHRIDFTATGSRLELLGESIEDAVSYSENTQAHFYYQFRHGRGALALRDGGQRALAPEELALDESILSQLKDPHQYPELSYLAEMYMGVRLYREWSFGRSSVFRAPQPADLPSDRLEEDFSNLGLILNRLRGVPKAKNKIIEYLRDLYEGVHDFDVRVKGGTVEVTLTEGDFVIPASRLSDGTLRYLCLLAILCDPEPPALICIEEPELGLHPDMLPKIADLLVAASERTQIIVTTHSDILVDAMTDRPESVVVVERHGGQTRAKRLTLDKELQEFLQKYRLGQLWMQGDIGGTRW